MGLDIYADPIARYVAGDWMTIVQQAGVAEGFPVEVLRMNEPADQATDAAAIAEAVAVWRSSLMAKLGLEADGWVEQADGSYLTDKPDWDGYGAVVLLAAYLERPDLAPGATVRRRLQRASVASVTPRDFSDAPAFKAATESPTRFPTLLTAEWCLPVTSGPAVFETETPNGTVLRMGRVDKLRAELQDLNANTLQLSTAGLAKARDAGPPPPRAPVEDVAPFGLAVLLELAEFAVRQRVAWILDY